MTIDVAAARTVTPAELRGLFLFEAWTPPSFDRLVAAGSVRRVGPGRVYAEGEPGTHCFVLLDGHIAVSRRSGFGDVELNRAARAAASTSVPCTASTAGRTRRRT